jgi:hypothetical protein
MFLRPRKGTSGPLAFMSTLPSSERPRIPRQGAGVLPERYAETRRARRIFQITSGRSLDRKQPAAPIDRR